MNPVTAYLNWINDEDGIPFPEEALSLSPMLILQMAQDDPDAMIRLNLIINNVWSDRKPDIEQLGRIHKKFHTHNPSLIKKEEPKPKPQIKQQQPKPEPPKYEAPPAWVSTRGGFNRPKRKILENTNEIVLPDDIDKYMLVNVYTEVDPESRNVLEVSYVLRNDKEKLIIPSDEYVDMYYGYDKDYTHVRPISELQSKRIPYSTRYRVIDELHDGGYAVYGADIQLSTQKILEWKKQFPNSTENHYPLRMVNVDIEVYQEGYGRVDFANIPDSARHTPINLITVYDNYTNIYKTFIYNLNRTTINIDKIKDYLDYQDENIEVKIYDSETDMLLAFFKLMRDLDPDICLSWNGTEFDLPYIYYRSRELGVPPMLSHNKKLAVTYRKTTTKLGEEITYTVNHLGYAIDLDYERCYKERTTSRRENYKLNTIAKIELGIEKINTEAGMDKIFREEPEKFIAYNINDVHLVRKLDEKLQYVELCFTIAKVSNISWDSIYTTLRICDGLIYEKLLSQGKTVKVLEKKENAVKQGAYVRNPIPGFAEYVGDLDATSMYPYIMARYNISADTLVGYIPYKIAHQYMYDKDSFDRLGDVPLTIKENGRFKVYTIPSERFAESMKKHKYIITHAGTIFKCHEDKLSIMYEIIDMLISLRKKYRDLMKEYVNSDKMLYDRYKIFQLTMKIITNSLYGAQANENFRLYSKEVAESITATGREIIRLAAFTANKYIEKIIQTGDPDNVGKLEDLKPDWPERSEEVLPNVIYGDSVVGSTLIDTANGKENIEQIWVNLYDNNTYSLGNREYILNPDLQVLSQNGKYENVLAIMKHTTTKKMYEISDDMGHSVIVTEDHSIMIKRNGTVLQVKPTEIGDHDELITL